MLNRKVKYRCYQDKQKVGKRTCSSCTNASCNFVIERKTKKIIMENKKINELVEKFKNVKLCCHAVDILDEMWEYNKLIGVDDVNNIRIIHSFLKGLCVGEGLNTQNLLNWFTCFNDTIFDMFLGRHGYNRN